MKPGRGSDLRCMVSEVVLTAALLLGLVLWRCDRTRLRTRLLDDARTRALPVELALWWQDRAGGQASERAAATRRGVQRIESLAGALGLDEATSYGIQLALALPPGMLAEEHIVLPGPTRRALALRHARWDGNGIPADVRGAQIPIEAQLLGLLDWLEMHDGSPQHGIAAMLQAEGGRRFSKTLAALITERLGELRLTGFVEAAARFRVTDGAILVVTPDGLGQDPPDRRSAILGNIHALVRGSVRPIDRAYVTETDVVVWLTGTDAGGAMAVRDRLAKELAEVSFPGIDVGTLACGTSVALAGTDGTSFTDLLGVARSRCARRREQAV